MPKRKTMGKKWLNTFESYDYANSYRRRLSEGGTKVGKIFVKNGKYHFYGYNKMYKTLQRWSKW